MKNFRKIKEKDITKLRNTWKTFDNYFINESENTYIINYKNISYILIQSKNQEDLSIEIYEFNYNNKVWNNIYGAYNLYVYTTGDTVEKLFRKSKRIIFNYRYFCYEI